MQITESRLLTWRVHLALLSGGLIYGASYSLTKWVMPAFIEPRTFILLRVVGAFLLMALYNVIAGNSLKVRTKDIWPLFYCSIFGVVLNMEMFFAGLKLTSPVHASLIMVCTPIFVLLIGYLYGSERLSLNKIAGILLGTAGAGWLISQSSGSQAADSSLLGDIFILINAISFATYLVLSRPLMSRYKPMVVNFYTFLIGFVFVIPLGFSGLREIKTAEMLPMHWGVFAFIIVATTFLTYTFNAFALNHVKSSVVGSYIYLQPLFAILITVVIGQVFTWPQALCGLVNF